MRPIVRRVGRPPEWLVDWAVKKYKTVSGLLGTFDRRYVVGSHGTVHITRVAGRRGTVLVIGNGAPVAFEQGDPDSVNASLPAYRSANGRTVTRMQLSPIAGNPVVPVGATALSARLVHATATLPAVGVTGYDALRVATKLYAAGLGYALRALVVSRLPSGSLLRVLSFVTDDAFLADTGYGATRSSLCVVLGEVGGRPETAAIAKPVTAADSTVTVIPMHRLLHLQKQALYTDSDVVAHGVAHDLGAALGANSNIRVASFNPCSPLYVSNVEYASVVDPGASWATVDPKNTDPGDLFPPTDFDFDFVDTPREVGTSVTSAQHGVVSYAAGAFSFTPVSVSGNAATVEARAQLFGPTDPFWAVSAVTTNDAVSAAFAVTSFGALVPGASVPTHGVLDHTAGGLSDRWNGVESVPSGYVNGDPIPSAPLHHALPFALKRESLSSVSLQIDGAPAATVTFDVTRQLSTAVLAQPRWLHGFDGSDIATSTRVFFGSGAGPPAFDEYTYSATRYHDLGWQPLETPGEALGTAIVATNGLDAVHSVFWRKADGVNDGFCVFTRTLAYPAARAAYVLTPNETTLAAMRAEQTVVFNNCLSLEFIDDLQGNGAAGQGDHILIVT